jgi:hypothetical protein
MGHSPSSELTLAQDEVSALLDLVEGTLSTALAGSRVLPTLDDLPPGLHARSGLFVSLHVEGELNGCIGTIDPVCAATTRLGPPRHRGVAALASPSHRCRVQGRPRRRAATGRGRGRGHGWFTPGPVPSCGMGADPRSHRLRRPSVAQGRTRTPHLAPRNLHRALHGHPPLPQGVARGPPLSVDSHRRSRYVGLTQEPTVPRWIARLPTRP